MRALLDQDHTLSGNVTIFDHRLAILGTSDLRYGPWQIILRDRVAELGSLSSGAKMAMQIFVKRVFTIFASNALFLRVIANLQN